MRDRRMPVVGQFTPDNVNCCSSIETCGTMNYMIDELSWLQRWYSAHCDGEWEHGSGITIETIDNPGWSMTIGLYGTELDSASFEPVKTDISETDWVRCRVAEREQDKPSTYRRFEGYGGASNLNDIIRVFRTWVETQQ